MLECRPCEMYDWWHRPTSMCHVRGRLIRVRDSRPAARRRGRRPDVWAVAMVQCIQVAHAWDISRQSPPVVRLYLLLCRAHVEMLDWQGDCDDITHHLAGLFACEALGQKRARLTPCRKPAKTASTRAQSECSGPNRGKHSERIAAPTVERDI